MRAGAGRLSAILSLMLVGPAAVRASIIHNEAVDGDLSGDRFNPTDLMLSFGSNTLTATSVSGDLEYVTLTVPPTFQLDAIMLDSYISADDQAFIAIQSGTTFTEPPAGTNPANLLGWTHFGTAFSHVGTNILDDIGMGPGSMGFAPPLLNGDYTFWIQETGPLSATYTLDFVVSPEPASLLALGLAGLALVRRRR